MYPLSATNVNAPAQGIKQISDVAYGSVEACVPLEYDGPYGVLLGERYTVVHSVATDSANEEVAVVLEPRG